MPDQPISSAEAVELLHTEAAKTKDSINTFAAETFRTRGGRLGSGMGSLIEAIWIYYMNRALHDEGGDAAQCEIGWLADHELNDFACIRRNAPWNSATRQGELFRIEAKSMNLGVDESKAHFTELSREIGEHDQLLVLTWKWHKADDWRFCPQVDDYILCSAKKVAKLRDALHVARGGTFVSADACADECDPLLCAHVGEPLNASGKRERKGGPDHTRPSEKVAFANNFGGLVRMLKTDNAAARTTFRKERKADEVAHDYISFIHDNFPDEEVNQYLISEWRTVAATAGIETEGLDARAIVAELKATVPSYKERLRDLLA